MSKNSSLYCRVGLYTYAIISDILLFCLSLCSNMIAVVLIVQSIGGGGGGGGLYGDCMTHNNLLPYRDHYLAYWIELVSQSPILPGLYEPDSFLRDRELLHFLLGTLSSTHSVPVRLEPLLTQGL